jgi:hypothetical protein
MATTKGSQPRRAMVFDHRNSGHRSHRLAAAQFQVELLLRNQAQEEQAAEIMVRYLTEATPRLLPHEAVPEPKPVVFNLRDSAETIETSSFTDSSPNTPKRPIHMFLTGEYARPPYRVTKIKLVGKYARSASGARHVKTLEHSRQQLRIQSLKTKIKLVGKFRVCQDTDYQRFLNTRRVAIVEKQPWNDNEQADDKIRYHLEYSFGKDDDESRVVYIYDNKLKHLVFHGGCEERNKTLEETYVDSRLIFLRDTATNKYVYMDESFVDEEGNPMEIAKFSPTKGRIRVKSPGSWEKQDLPPVGC